MLHTSRLHRISMSALIAASLFSTLVIAGAQKPPEFKVFMSSEAHMGLGVASTIIYGEQDAVLVDAQFTLSNAYRLVAEIIETNRRLGLGGARWWHRREGLREYLVHLPSQHVDVGAAHGQHLLPVLFIGDGPQQVFE